MRLKFASLLLALSSLTVSACGFTPVYGTNLDAAQGSIQIEQIDGVAGHALRKELVMQLRPGLPGVEQGRLVVRLKERKTRFQFKPEGGNLRTTATAQARYTLYTEDGNISGSVTGNSSYFAATLPYADIMSDREAEIRAAMDVAQKLVTDLHIKAARGDSFSDESVEDEPFTDEDEEEDVDFFATEE